MDNISLKDIEDICKREFNENYLNPYYNEITDNYIDSHREEIDELIKNLKKEYELESNL